MQLTQWLWMHHFATISKKTFKIRNSEMFYKAKASSFQRIFLNMRCLFLCVYLDNYTYFSLLVNLLYNSLICYL